MRTLWRLIASFFKWTWRILNFIRKLALNAIFLVLVLVCIGIWSQFSSTTSEHTARGALLLDITGVVVDKPSASSKLGVIGRQLFWRQLGPFAGEFSVRYRADHPSGEG
ncbi:protease [Klebsiella quasipneumoniae]|nr:protease [Klebsiella quasipneumoniae]